MDEDFGFAKRGHIQVREQIPEVLLHHRSGGQLAV
jgi:hypothetical protein